MSNDEIRHLQRDVSRLAARPGLRLRRECGYTGIEIAPFTLAKYAYDLSAARRGEVRRQIEAAGLETIGLHWLLRKPKAFI